MSKPRLKPNSIGERLHKERLCQSLAERFGSTVDPPLNRKINLGDPAIPHATQKHYDWNGKTAAQILEDGNSVLDFSSLWMQQDGSFGYQERFAAMETAKE